MKTIRILQTEQGTEVTQRTAEGEVVQDTLQSRELTKRGQRRAALKALMRSKAQPVLSRKATEQERQQVVAELRREPTPSRSGSSTGSSGFRQRRRTRAGKR